MYVLPCLLSRKLSTSAWYPSAAPAVGRAAGRCPGPASRPGRYPTSVFTAAVISASAFFASAKYMLVFGLMYSSLSMPA